MFNNLKLPNHLASYFRNVVTRGDEFCIPLILKSKILKENIWYFILIIILNISLWIVLGFKANVLNIVMKDPGLYFHLPYMICILLATRVVFERYKKVFNIDIYNSSIINEKSEEFERIRPVFLDEKNIDHQQQQLLKLIFNKSERLIIIFGLFITISVYIINAFILGKDFGKMLNLYVFPWTLIAHLMNFFYWNLFIFPMSFSLFWVIAGIIRGINLLLGSYQLKLLTNIEAEEVDFCNFSLQKIEYNIKPILDLAFLISSFTIIFAFIYTVTVVWMNLTYPYPYLYFLSFLMICLGLTIYIWPQLYIHKLLEKLKEKILKEYYKLYENRKSEYLNNLIKDFKTNENVGNDLLILKDIVSQTEHLSTWPYLSRTYKLLGGGMGSIILILIQISANRLIS